MCSTTFWFASLVRHFLPSLRSLDSYLYHTPSALLFPLLRLSWLSNNAGVEKGMGVKKKTVRHSLSSGKRSSYCVFSLSKKLISRGNLWTNARTTLNYSLRLLEQKEGMKRKEDEEIAPFSEENNTNAHKRTPYRHSGHCFSLSMKSFGIWSSCVSTAQEV